MKWMAVLALVTAPVFAQTRIASDFEIAQMKRQIATSPDFLSQLSGHLNLGDAYRARNESAKARTEYGTALDIAGREALAARKASDITRYATAVAYSSLANAKLGNDGPAFEAAEEAIRYTSGSAKSWNLYSTATSLLHKPAKAASAARNAVAIAKQDLAKSPNVGNRLDLAIYQYSLASALIETGKADEAELLLRTVTSSLRSEDFASLRRDVARSESFEIYSSARGDQPAYLSLVNRSGLRLAALREQRGDAAGARREYENVLASRTGWGLVRIPVGDAQVTQWLVAGVLERVDGPTDELAVHDHVDIDDRLRGETRNRCRAHVLDGNDRNVGERHRQPVMDRGEHFRPLRVAVDHDDRVVHRCKALR